MRIDITEFEKGYSFDLRPITQLCGQNIAKKSFILETFRRHFSSYKYQEGEEKWINNIKIEGSVIGRKYFNVLSIRDRGDVIGMIRCTKQSLMMDYLKQLLQNFELQKKMDNINVELESIFSLLNNEICQLGDIELDYSMSDIWDIISKSDVYGENQTRLDNKSGYELIRILLNLIKQKLKSHPQKQVIILENLDHILTIEEYVAVLKIIKEMINMSDIYFIIATSLDGYVECDSDNLSGVFVLGDVDFQMPDFDVMKRFIKENYPCNKILNDYEIRGILIKLVQKIGRKNYLCSIEENVICKLINQTLLLDEKLNTEDFMPEMAFLKS